MEWKQEHQHSEITRREKFDVDISGRSFTYQQDLQEPPAQKHVEFLEWEHPITENTNLGEPAEMPNKGEVAEMSTSYK